MPSLPSLKSTCGWLGNDAAAAGSSGSLGRAPSGGWPRGRRGGGGEGERDRDAPLLPEPERGRLAAADHAQAEGALARLPDRLRLQQFGAAKVPHGPTIVRRRGPGTLT